MKHVQHRPLGWAGIVLIGVSLGACAVGDGAQASAPVPDVSNTSTIATSTPQLLPGDPADYIAVPGGKRVHKTCIHEVPNGASFDQNDDVWLRGTPIAHIDPCRYAPLPDSTIPIPAMLHSFPGDSYQYTSSSSAQVEWLRTDWVVPSKPINGATGQTLFIWNGVLDTTFELLQPVLRFPDSAGQPNWMVNSWWVYNSTTTASPVIVTTGYQVNVGDAIDGQIVHVAGYTGGYQQWEIIGTNNSVSPVAQTALTGWLHFNSWTDMANELVLEVWNLSLCSQLPHNGLVFGYNSALQVGSTIMPWTSWFFSPLLHAYPVA